MPALMTSGPMPSPGMEAMLYLVSEGIRGVRSVVEVRPWQLERMEEKAAMWWSFPAMTCGGEKGSLFVNILICPYSLP